MNLRSFYRVTLIILLLAISGQGLVSAYYLTLESPTEVRVGQSFNVSGITNIPPPDKIDVVFSQSINIPVEVTRKSIQITDKGESSFNLSFDTTGLEKGNYKVEALSQTQRDFSAGSINLRVIKLTDRSDIIRFSSPKYQDFSGTLVIEARIQDYDDNSIQMEIKKGNNTVFGPESVPVSKARVKHELPITEQGEYTVIFTDYKGYVGAYPIQVGEETQTPPKESATPGTTPAPVEGTAQPTEKVPEQPTEQPTKTPVQEPSTPVPTETPAEKPTPEDKPADNSSSSGSAITATAQVSRDNPGYFLISVKETPVTIKTSANADWVLEYKTKPDAAAVKVNDKMKEAAEQATITTDTREISVKVYPYNYKSGEEVTLTVTSAESISLSDAAAKAFGAPPRYGSQKAAGTGKSPAPIAGLILGLIGAAWFVRRS